MIRIAFIGDFLYPFNNKVFLRQDDIFDDIDICIGNLESPIIIEGKEYNKLNKLINLYSLEGIIEFLKEFKIKVVSIANNHIFDYGIEGFKDTLKYLDKFGVKYCGAGFSLSDARIPCIINVKGIRLCVLSYGWELIQCITATAKKPGVASLKREIILEDISNIRKYVDFIIVMVHWGYELEIYPLPVHRKLGREIIEAGADLVIGAHPHVIQGYEKWKDGFIFYSLGNFFFPDILFGKVKVNFNGKFAKKNILPYSLLVRAKIDFDTVLDIDLYKVGIKEYNNKYIVNFEKFDKNFINYLNKLNYPLILEENEYLKFFLKNRKVKKGIPVFKGNKVDKIRFIIFKLREKVITIVIRISRILKKLWGYLK